MPKEPVPIYKALNAPLLGEVGFQLKQGKTTTVYRGDIGIMENEMESTVYSIYRGFIGNMERKWKRLRLLRGSGGCSKQVNDGDN